MGRLDRDARLHASWRFLPWFAVPLAAILPYLGLLDAPFVFDDIKLVKENKLLRTGFEDPRKVLGTFDITSRRWDEEELRPNYRPLRFLSYLIDYRLTRAWFGEVPESGPRTFFFHLTNVLLHAANALLVFAVARSLARVFLPGDASAPRLAAFAGLCAGLLFALHPVETEAVTYVSGRRDVLSTFFFLAASSVYLRAGHEAPPGAVVLIVVPVLFALGLLSKEAAVTLCPALVLLDLACRSRWGWRRALLHALNAAVAVIFVKITISNTRLIAEPAAEGLLSTALTACRYAARYLGLVLCPVSQSIDYSFDAIPPSAGLLSPLTSLPALLLALGLLGTAAWKLWRVLVKRENEGCRWDAAIALGLLWFLGTLVPVLQLVPIPERFAERFVYLPSVGIIFLAAMAIARVRRFEPVLGWGLAGLLCVLAFAGATRRNADWRTPLELWTSAVRAQPRAARAHLGRANALKEARLWREAAEEYSLALEIFEEKPALPLHHGFILQAVAMRGGVYGLLAAQDSSLLDRAAADYRRVLAMKDTDGVVIESSPKHTVLHFDLAGLLLKKGDGDGAAREYRRVVEIGTPVSLVGAARYYLGKIALSNGDPRAAAASLQEAYEVIPGDDPAKFPVAVELADLLIEQKELDAAQNAVHRAMADGASGKMRLHLLTRGAKVLDRRGDLEGCLAALERIVAEDATYAPALLTLGGIEAGQGKHDEAEKRFRAVLAADPESAEALRGLQNVTLLRKVAEGRGGGAIPEPDSVALLEAVEKKALESLLSGELLAAREELANLLARATAAKRIDFQVTAIRGLAGVEERLGHWKKAEEHLKAALELAPSDPEILRKTADLYLRRFDERVLARRYYERYIEAMPGGAAGDPLVRLNLAELIGSTDPHLAIAHLEKAKEAGYTEPELDRALGYRHADLGRWKDSLDAFNRYLDRTGPLDAAGREDPARNAAKEFVRRSVLPHVEE